MENPETDIILIIHNLTTSPPSLQRKTLETFFTPNASFTHPFCRTGSFDNSRWLILQVYRWYKILSPRIEIEVESVAWDRKYDLLYVRIHQKFRIWAFAWLGYVADVRLVTVLDLTSVINAEGAVVRGDSSGSDGKKKYWIQGQNDLYQTSEWIKFLVPWGIGSGLMILWQLFATVMCVLGAFALSPITVLLEKVIGGNEERLRNDKVWGSD